MQLSEPIEARSLEHRHSVLGQKQADEILGCVWARCCYGYRYCIGGVGAAERLSVWIGVSCGCIPILHRRVALIDLLGKIEKRQSLDQWIRDVSHENVDASTAD